MSGMAAPRITLRCDCGAEALVAFGDRWTCESCGRTYDTAGIPEADFQAIQDLDGDTGSRGIPGSCSSRRSCFCSR